MRGSVRFVERRVVRSAESAGGGFRAFAQNAERVDYQLDRFVIGAIVDNKQINS